MLTSADDIFSAYDSNFEFYRDAEMELSEYLELCRREPQTYATAAERLLAAIGEPGMVDEFRGLENEVEQISDFLRCAARTPDHYTRLLVLYDKHGDQAARMAARLAALADREPIFALKAASEVSPALDDPLAMLEQWRPNILEPLYGIPRRRLAGPVSPWCAARLRQLGDNPSRFDIVRLRRLVVMCQFGVSANAADADARLRWPHRDDLPGCAWVLPQTAGVPLQDLRRCLAGLWADRPLTRVAVDALHRCGVVIAHANEATWHSIQQRMGRTIGASCTGVRLPVAHSQAGKSKIGSSIRYTAELLTHAGLAVGVEGLLKHLLGRGGSA